MKKISVIMASYLGEYPGCASNREHKFVRAVKTYLTQTYENKELIIVSDGCDITERLYHFNFSKYDNIKFIKIDKQPLYGGDVRNVGIGLADGDIITYLDNDDIIGKKHLENIVNNFEGDLVYYNDYMVLSPDFKKLQLRDVEPRYGSIGTSSISHRKIDGIVWEDGYGHDFIFFSKFIVNGYKFKKIKSPQYLVCHYKNGDF